jgi:16S rRNA (adenine1518-N6/adenine1519-N6)-dimethyltransferase
LTDVTEKDFFRVVKAGFSAKRKKLRSSLSAGLGISKDDAVAYLEKANISPDSRAESLSLDDWQNLARVIA